MGPHQVRERSCVETRRSEGFWVCICIEEGDNPFERKFFLNLQSEWEFISKWWDTRSLQLFKWERGVEKTSSKCCKFSNVEECFSSCWEIQRLSLRKCVEETSSKCCKFSSVEECFSSWKLQHWSLRKCVEETSSSCCELQH